MFTPFGANIAKSNGHKKAIADVTSWVTEELKRYDQKFSEDKYQVMVTEIQCNEPNCVPIETLVIIMLLTESLSPAGTEKVDQTDSPAMTSHAKKQKWADKILVPVKDVTKQDVQDLMCSLFELAEEQEPVIDSGVKQFSMKLALLTEEHVTSADEDSQLLVAMAEVLESAAINIRKRVQTANDPVAESMPSAPVLPQITRVVMTPTVTTTSASATASAASATVVSTSFPSTSATATTATTATAVSSRPESNPVAAIGESAAEPVQQLSVSPSTQAAVEPMVPNPKQASVSVSAPKITITGAEIPTGSTLAPRHKKGGTRPRGCPCCDPDNLDNIVDSLMFSHYPQT